MVAVRITLHYNVSHPYPFLATHYRPAPVSIPPFPTASLQRRSFESNNRQSSFSQSFVQFLGLSPYTQHRATLTKPRRRRLSFSTFPRFVTFFRPELLDRLGPASLVPSKAITRPTIDPRNGPVAPLNYSKTNIYFDPRRL